MGRILFITGTDTGVGKTVVTSLLLYHLRQAGVNALGLKPFCCGGREDAEKLREIQGEALALDEVNPFYFKAPLAPLAAGRMEGRRASRRQALAGIARVLPRCDKLLVEGCGGLLAPLGENFSFLDVIVRLGGDILVVAPNQLGVLNQVLLTLQALPAAARKRAKILLMEQRRPDLSARTNGKILGEYISAKRVFCLPFLGCKCLDGNNLKKCCKKVKKTLAALGH